MLVLVAGLVLFVAVHLIPTVVPLRGALIGRLGAGAYRGLFSLVALAGLVLIVWGFARAPFEPLYTPPSWGRSLAVFTVPVSLVLLAAANMPTHIRAVLRHPMLLGVLIWAIAHLLSNGDLRSVVLFGGFAGYAVIDLVSVVARGKRPSTEKPPRLAMDGVAIVAGLVAAGLFTYFHAALFGMPAI